MLRQTVMRSTCLPIPIFGPNSIGSIRSGCGALGNRVVEPVQHGLCDQPVRPEGCRHGDPGVLGESAHPVRQAPRRQKPWRDDDLTRAPATYAIRVRDETVAEGNLDAALLLAIGDAPVLAKIDGTPAREPV